eukprot:PhM_4_TR10559/c0_g1_i1/m.60573
MLVAGVKEFCLETTVDDLRELVASVADLLKLVERRFCWVDVLAPEVLLPLLCFFLTSVCAPRSSSPDEPVSSECGISTDRAPKKLMPTALPVALDPMLSTLVLRRRQDSERAPTSPCKRFTKVVVALPSSHSLFGASGGGVICVSTERMPGRSTGRVRTNFEWSAPDDGVVSSADFQHLKRTCRMVGSTLMQCGNPGTTGPTSIAAACWSSSHIEKECPVCCCRSCTASEVTKISPPWHSRHSTWGVSTALPPYSVLRRSEFSRSWCSLIGVPACTAMRTRGPKKMGVPSVSKRLEKVSRPRTCAGSGIRTRFRFTSRAKRMASLDSLKRMMAPAAVGRIAVSYDEWCATSSRPRRSRVKHVLTVPTTVSYSCASK